MASSPGVMLLYQLLQRARPEQSPLAEPLRRQRRARLVLEQPREPLRQRRHESLLLPMHDLRRQKLFRQPFQQILAGATVLLERGIETRADLKKPVIEVRHPRLQSIG